MLLRGGLLFVELVARALQLLEGVAQAFEVDGRGDVFRRVVEDATRYVSGRLRCDL